MNRKLASVQIIKDIREIPKAENILAGRIMGWSVVFNKSEGFKDGDKVLFFEIDALLPDIPQFAFMAKDKFRVKTRKMKGASSQGLCLPLSAFNFKPEQFAEGEDLTALLQIQKFERPEIQLSGDVAGYFPSFIPKTDCPRLQSYPEVLDHLPGQLAVTVKCDGSSFTAYQHNGHFGICSRNVELKPSEGNTFWQIARKYDLENKLKGLNLAIQGELCGPKIQENRMGLARHKLFVFDIFNIESQQYYSFDELKDLCQRLELPMVPIVSEYFETPKNFGIKDWLDLAKGKYENGGHREGIVVKSMTEIFCPPLQGRTTFKVISIDYLLKYNES